MKSLKKVLILATIFLLTGCASMSLDLKIKNNDTGAATYIIGYNTAMMEEYDMDTDEYLESLDEQWASEDATIEDYNFTEGEKSYVGKKISFVFDNLEELNAKLINVSEEEEVESTDEYLQFTRNGNEVSVSLAGDPEAAESVEMMASFITYSVTIEVEGKIIQNNADEVDEKSGSMTWNYATIISDGIHATYDTSTVSVSSTNTLLYILLGIGIVGITIFILIKKQKK